MPADSINKLYIFDLDGTIANSFFFYVDLVNHNREMFNTDGVDPLELKQLREFSIRYLLKEFNIGLFKFRKLQEFMMEEFGKNLASIPIHAGLKKVLDELKTQDDVKVGLLTSNTQRNANLYLKAHDIDDAFSFVMSSNNLFGKHKYIKKLRKFYHVLNSQVYYIGDETRDIEAAKKAHVNSVAVTWGFNSKDLLEKRSPDYIFDEIDQLYEFIKA